jgi:hypothetical protein
VNIITQEVNSSTYCHPQKECYKNCDGFWNNFIFH